MSAVTDATLDTIIADYASAKTALSTLLTAIQGALDPVNNELQAQVALTNMQNAVINAQVALLGAGQMSNNIGKDAPSVADLSSAKEVYEGPLNQVVGAEASAGIETD